MSESVSAKSNATQKSLNLDEVFVLKAPPSKWIGGGSSPEKKQQRRRIKLTPLSKKACLIHGIDPIALQEREYTSFAEPGLDPEIQTMRFEMYCRTRENLMRVASEERKKMMARGNESFSTSNSDSIISTASKTSSSHSLAQHKQQEVSSTLVEIERRRLEKVANRQKKELMRMLAFESKSQEIMDKMRIKAEEQEKKELQRKKEKRKRDLKAAEEARLRELRRKAREEAEVGLQRIQMQEQFERDKKIREERERQEKETKRLARMEDEKRARKRELHRIQTEKMKEQQRREAEVRMAEQEAKEREREEKKELKRLVEAQVIEAKRKEAAEKIEQNLKAAKEKEEEKRLNLLEKQARHTELLDQIHEEKQREIERQHELNAAMERKRQYQRKMKRVKEEEAKESVRKKIEAHDASLEQLTEQRRREQNLLKAEKELQLQMKKENLERIRRKQEYQAKETMRKVEENDRRGRELKKRKDELQRLRQKKAAEARVIKDKLMEALDQSKTSGGSTAIKKLLSKISTNEDILSFGSNKNEVNESNFDQNQIVSIDDLGPTPEAPSLAKRLGNDETPAIPYKSPYVTDYAEADGDEDYVGIDIERLHVGSIDDPFKDNTTEHHN